MSSTAAAPPALTPPALKKADNRGVQTAPKKAPEGSSGAVATTVTPAEEAEEKQVRFYKDDDPVSKKKQPCVSKRGRYVSPGRRNATLEYQAYRSPDVPSLCSAPSVEEKGTAESAIGPTSPKPKETTYENDKSPTGLFLQSPKADQKLAYEARTPTTAPEGNAKPIPDSFDTSNVLSWLQSPTSLFSPGLGSMLTTPRPASTPTVSTSFFFSDVANLPKHEQESDNVICISPLATKNKSAGTPVDLKEVFSSPSERKFQKNGMASRDLEDEDLSVLLQLASNTTPGVFRGKKEENLPSLQLPMIGQKDTKGPRLEQKPSKTEDFCPPQLGMRNSGTKKELYAKKEKSKDKPAFPPQAAGASGAPAAYYAMPPPGAGGMRISMGGPKKEFPDYHYMYPPYMGYPPYGYPPPPRGIYSSASNSGAGGKDTAASAPMGSTKKRSPKRATSADSETDKPKKKRCAKKKKSPVLTDKADREKAAATIQGLNAASGGKNNKAAALAAAILRGVTMRPSGKWQAQLYFCGKSRYIGVFDTLEKAALAYEIARERLKAGHVQGSDQATVENLVNSARKAAFDGVNERLK